ncbi:MAG: tRNA (adenosine(37)-N6)-threonylcarbamoyltransferase complex ATPase subunit type 1 TsaE [Firmicutes bacterium]|nr:tRNA (adenosine(37)-N6)-threonylcarbamoyltransferase complex ATPase subunit type 1 TsaE [Bacillota bacterium]
MRISGNTTRIMSESSEQTEKIAYDMAAFLEPGDVVCLGGDLGAGKTVFAKGLMKALGVEGYVTSPTFTIVNEYSGKYPIYHFDVYRINDVDEMFEIGFEEYIYGEGISIIEWADNIREILPPSRLRIDIKKDLQKGENYREIEIRKVGGGE